MRTKTEVVATLRDMLKDVFSAKAAGETYARLSRAHGYVDGYMRALLELGMVTRQELLEIVASEREKASGPALRTLEEISTESDDVVAA
jgi:hypothetical protein